MARSCVLAPPCDLNNPRLVKSQIALKQGKEEIMLRNSKNQTKQKIRCDTVTRSSHRLQSKKLSLLFVTNVVKGHISHFTIIYHSALLQSTTVANIHSPLIVCFDETILAKIYYLFYLLFDEHDVRNKIQEQ